MGVLLDQIDAAAVVGEGKVDHLQGAGNNERNRASANGPSRDSSNRAVLGTTGAGTSRSLRRSRNRSTQASWRGSPAAHSSPWVSHDKVTGVSDVVGQGPGSEVAANLTDVQGFVLA